MGMVKLPRTSRARICNSFPRSVKCNYYRSICIGTTSLAERSSPEECCTFRGSLAKLDVKSGAVLWQTFMLPENHGELGQYAGAAIWGSSPSIDVHRKHVYIATGNVYSIPERVSQCQENQNNSTMPTNLDACVEPENHGNSIPALDLDSGDIKWYRQLGGYDVWFLASPMMLRTRVNGTNRDIVVAVQKGGFAWALDRNNGSLCGQRIQGGGTWGAATDKKMVYTNIGNADGKNFTLKPSNYITIVSVANGVLFAGSPNPQGSIYAMDTGSGKILWSYDARATVYGGMSISNGCIYVGSGYKVNLGFINPTFTAGTSLFAFCVK
ncbi:polyvinylalcohol dehydrogenase-like [Pyrus ussuriensis x Pyrus communis]|uniref:Polyvinylalcohol dehydrogenase-like n=1 Tax=Pyrus ussuriensis x Pyrus communis TaxID=2448454 RepID=A0A5N5GFU4_9ROSA|nr:polyvinylalcohol dehydrogenase-like [Pyrus ussuriensis x Pyrus communis]